MEIKSDEIAPVKRKVVFCMPTVVGPYPEFIKSLEASIPLLVEAGWDEGISQEIGNPYISAARSTMTRKALDAKADVIVYLDHDLSWDAHDLLKLIETEGDVVGGTYRFKKDEEVYMGSLLTHDDMPIVRESDGAVRSSMVPAGFLKVTRAALISYARRYPELLYGDPFNYCIDLFSHGAHDGIWWGEDYAFCRRWSDMGGEIWTPPDMNIHHHTKDGVFEGNLHKFLLRQEGGSNYEKEK
jgi:hypothetical protein